MNDHTAQTLHFEQLEGLHADLAAIFDGNPKLSDPDYFQSHPKPLRDDTGEKLKLLIGKIRMMDAAENQLPEYLITRASIINDATAWQKAVFFQRICLLCAYHGKETDRNGTRHFCHLTEQPREVETGDTCIWFEGVGAMS